MTRFLIVPAVAAVLAIPAHAQDTRTAPQAAPAKPDHG